MATPKYKKNKYFTPEEFEEFTALTEEQLVDKIKAQEAYLTDQEQEKKESGVLKEIKAEIKEYRDKWNDNNPERVAELERLQEEVKAIKAERDARIESDLDEQKLHNGDYNDKINGAKARIRALAYCLRFQQ